MQIPKKVLPLVTDGIMQMNGIFHLAMDFPILAFEQKLKSVDVAIGGEGTAV